jgi:hypothetical protein
MVDRILATAQLPYRIIDAERLGGRRGLFCGAAEAEDARVDGLDVIADNRWRIALRIERHEQRLDFCRQAVPARRVPRPLQLTGLLASEREPIPQPECSGTLPAVGSANGIVTADIAKW